MNTEQIEAAIDKVLRKRGAAGSSYFTTHRIDLKQDLLAALQEAWRLDFSARGRLTPAELAKQIRWECIAAETPLRASDPAVMVGSEHSEPDLSFLEGDSKTYEITLERAFSAWRAVIKDRDGIVVDRILGRYMDSRADIFFAAKTLVKDLQKQKTLRVNAEGMVIQ